MALMTTSLQMIVWAGMLVLFFVSLPGILIWSGAVPLGRSLMKSMSPAGWSPVPRLRSWRRTFYVLYLGTTASRSPSPAFESIPPEADRRNEGVQRSGRREGKGGSEAKEGRGIGQLRA
jgi:hypothetical protein